METRAITLSSATPIYLDEAGEARIEVARSILLPIDAPELRLSFAATGPEAWPLRCAVQLPLRLRRRPDTWWFNGESVDVKRG